MAVRDLGIVTAYGYAVAGGYTGTEQEFTALLGDLALTVEDLENMTVSVTTLEPDQQATASYADGVLSLGIPRGRNGEVTQDDLDAQLENYATNEALFDAYIVKSAEGNIASFNDGADDVPMKSLKVAIVPKQSGSGDPSPDNVRPITGTSTANIKVAGKNLFSNVFTDYTMPSDYRICPIKLEMGKQYILSAVSDTSITGITVGIVRSGTRYADFEGFTIIVNGQGQVPAYNNPYRFTATEIWKDANLVIYARTEAEFSNALSAFKVQLEEGTARTEYEPYIGHTTNIPLGQTVYGGEVDVTEGEGTSTLDLCDFASIAWSSDVANANGVIRFAGVANNKANGVTNIVSSHFKTSEVLVPQNTNEELISGYSSGKGIYISIKASRLTGDLSTAAGRQTAFINWCTANDVIVLYESNAPTEITFTPTQVATLLGTNNVWADCGSVEVEYRADPTLAYNGISPSIASAIAPVEETNIATRNYTTGSYLIMDNTLYKVTAAIASGGTITVGTNVAATTIMAEIIAAL